MVTASLPRITSICHDSGFRLPKTFNRLLVVSWARVATRRPQSRSWAAMAVVGQPRRIARQRPMCLILYEVSEPEVLRTIVLALPRPKAYISHHRGKTPNEVYFSRPAANKQSRLEPRPRWPRGSPCAKPQVGIAGNPGDPIIVEIDCLEGRRHLPIIRARHAA